VWEWKRPPRFQARALRRAWRSSNANKSGPLRRRGLKNTLRHDPHPRPACARSPRTSAVSSSRYVCCGRLLPVKEYLAKHPHKTCVELESASPRPRGRRYERARGRRLAARAKLRGTGPEGATTQLSSTGSGAQAARRRADAEVA